MNTKLGNLRRQGNTDFPGSFCHAISQQIPVGRLVSLKSTILMHQHRPCPSKSKPDNRSIRHDWITADHQFCTGKGSRWCIRVDQPNPILGMTLYPVSVHSERQSDL